MTINPYYKTPIDIAFYFRDKESIAELLQFVLLESDLFSDAIDKNGNKIPYPIFYNTKAHKFQIDYQFFIHCLAKFVVSKTRIKSNYKQIVNSFAVLSGNIDSIFCDRNRMLLMFILETISVVFYAGNYDRKIKEILVFAPALFKYKDVFVNYKVLTIPDMNVDKNFYGFEFYLGNKWLERRERYYDFSLNNELIQVAFLNTQVKKFIREYNVIPYSFFQFNPFKFDKFVDYNEASILFNHGVKKDG